MAAGQPGEDVSRELLRALEMLESGDWDGAHQVAQEDRTAMGSWLHGIIHVIEGDRGNAAYWYQRAGRGFPGMDSVKREIAAFRSVLQQQGDG
jgi:predicted component of type VI protein secretion system